MGVQSCDQMAVLDVVAEGVEPDLGGREGNLGRAHQPASRVDDPHDPEAGAACPAQPCQTPRVSSAVTELESSAVVR